MTDNFGNESNVNYIHNLYRHEELLGNMENIFHI